jgi:hypothetical protein
MDPGRRFDEMMHIAPGVAAGLPTTDGIRSTNRASTLWRAGRRGFALASALALVGSLLVVTGAAAKPACMVVNDVTPGVSYVTLQSAVDAAGAGDTLQVKGTCLGNTTILKPLTIEGGPGATLDGTDAGSVLTIQNGGFSGFDPVTLVGLTITHGHANEGGGIENMGTRLTIVDSTVAGNVANAGGGIASNHAIVILDDSTVRDNAADVGGGIANTTNELHLYGSSSVRHNTARLFGGGIANGDGSVHLHERSSVDHNTTGGDGGGIRSAFGRVFLEASSSIQHNMAGGGGGGVFIDVGGLQLADSSSIRGNTAGGDGGGVNTGLGSEVILADASSISHNTAGGDGGGIWSANDLTTLTNCIAGVNVVHNRPDEIFLAP